MNKDNRGRCSPASLRCARWEPVCTHTCADLKKKKSHKKQHLCYRDVFNKYTERAPATKKSCQGQKEPSIGTVYISKFFQEEWKRLPSLMENGGATVRNLLAASSLRLLLQSSPLTRAWSREGLGGGHTCLSWDPRPGQHARLKLYNYVPLIREIHCSERRLFILRTPWEHQVTSFLPHASQVS